MTKQNNNTQETRFRVLEYSLTIEDEINSLLVLYLGIPDKTSTKLFGNKAGLTFKNKIDLLLDIEVFTKHDHDALELLMVIRNKFIHDIRCYTFLETIKILDSGIVKHFQIFLNDREKNTDEDSWVSAFGNLYINNLRIILEKISKRKTDLTNKKDLIVMLLEKYISSINMSFGLIDKILNELEKADLDDKKVATLAKAIELKCASYAQNMERNRNTTNLENKMRTLFTSDVLKSIFK